MAEAAVHVEVIIRDVVLAHHDERAFLQQQRRRDRDGPLGGFHGPLVAGVLRLKRILAFGDGVEAQQVVPVGSGAVRIEARAFLVVRHLARIPV